MNAIFRHEYPLAVEPASTPRPLVQKKTWRNSLPIDMLLSAVSVLVVAQSSSEIPEGPMNNPVYKGEVPMYAMEVYRVERQSFLSSKLDGISQLHNPFVLIWGKTSRQPLNGRLGDPEPV